MARFGHTLPSWWIDESSGPAKGLLDFLNQAQQAEEVADRLPAVGPVLAASLMAARPPGGWDVTCPLLEVADVSFGTLRVMLEAFATPSERNALARRFEDIERLSEPEALLLLEWTPSEHLAITDFVERATREELDAVPGYGEVLVDALLDLRRSSGRRLTDTYDIAVLSYIDIERLERLHEAAGASTGAGPDGPFLALSESLPVAMFPVRLETRFTQDALLVRVFPDVAHADGHHHGLTEDERVLGAAYWRTLWLAGPDDADVHAQARADLAARVGPFRAAWVARSLEPTNPGDRPAEAVAELAVEPLFPETEPRGTSRPVRARLLPDRWNAFGYRRGPYERSRMFQAHGLVIPRDLPMAPDLLTDQQIVDHAEGVRELLDAQGLRWTYDFEEAERLGMALRIPFSEMDEYTEEEGIPELYVVGVRYPYDPPAMAEELEDLLLAHRFTRDVAFVQQGTPTNNTDHARSGISPDHPDLEALFAAEVDLPPVLSSRPESPGDLDGATLYRREAAWQTGVAFGLPGASVVDRVDLADSRQTRLAWRMNQALWPATIGHFLDAMLDVLPDDEKASLRDWFADFVRGAGPMPALRLGEQPYGILPVSYVPHFDRTRDMESIEDVLGWAQRFWWDSLLAVAHLDPNATDAVGVATEPQEEDTYTEAVDKVSQVLGAVPHPTELFVHDAELLDIHDSWDAQIAWMTGLLVFAPASAARIDPIHVAMLDALGEASSMVREKAALQAAAGPAYNRDDYHDVIRTQGISADEKALAEELTRVIEENLIPLTEEHYERVGSAITYAPTDIWSTRVQDDFAPRVFRTEQGVDELSWEAPLVAPGTEAADLDEVRAWLGALSAQLSGGTPATTTVDPAPLLFQLLKRSVERNQGLAPDAPDRVALQDGLDGLLSLLDEAWVEEPLQELERAMRETLGLAMHRLDAWYTGVAADRLARLRETSPTGLQIGGYGWVVDLKRGDGKTSQGFVHAPSLDHAATAAVLRSGFAAYGAADDATSTMATDLSSERIRRARWILDGLRAGDSLDALLGARFERRMHEASLDRFVHPIRQAVLKAADSATTPAQLADPTAVPSRPASDVVDGLVLSRAYSGLDDLTALETDTRTAVDASIEAEATEAEADVVTAEELATRVREVLADLVADLDAVADATLAQSVHSLLKGDTATATATLSAMGSGDAPPPQLDFTRTPRGGTAVRHRAVILMPVEPAWSSWPKDLLALAEPRLEGWLASLLPRAHRVRFRVTFTGDDGAALSRLDLSLEDLQVSALSAVHLVSSGESLAGGRLEARAAVAVVAAWPAGVRTDATLVFDWDRYPGIRDTETSVAEVRLLALDLRQLLAGGRGLTAVDLQGPYDEEVELQADPELLDRAATLRQELLALRETLEAAVDAAGTGSAVRPVVDAMAALAAAGFPLPLTGRSELLATGGDAADRQALLGEAGAVLEAVDARLAQADALDATRAAEQADWTPGATLAHDRSLVRLLAGRPRLPVLTEVQVPDPDLDASFAFGPARIGDPTAARGWLDQLGHVRPRLGALSRALDTAEALADERLVHLEVAQLPHHEEDPWTAIGRPAAEADPGPRVCWLAQRFADAPLSASVSGLLVDHFVETLPVDEVTTGLTFHFDAPGNRPPQAVLLLAARPGVPWSLDEAIEAVRQTFDLTRLRCVGPEHLERLSQFLPAIYLAGDTDPGSPA